MSAALKILDDDLSGPEIADLLERHLDHMHSVTPAESVYALDIQALKVPEIRFWSAWLEGDLVGCIALKDLSDGHGEIKSAHTIAQSRGKGIGRALVSHLIDEAKRGGMKRLSLETGHTCHFEPAQRLYAGFGFEQCGPFGDYGPDPHSYFMTLPLGP